MKMTRMWIVVFFVLLSGCAPVAEECELCEECEVCEACEINPFPEGLVLPQVYIMAKLYYTAEDLTALQTNVLEPLIAYFEALDQTVVSIQIDNDNRTGTTKQQFLIDVIISDNDGNADPLYYGFIHEKVDGLIPVWVMETMD